VSTVAFLVHPDRAQAWDLAQLGVNWVKKAGHEARLLRLQGTNGVEENGAKCDLEQVDLAHVDLAVSLGGDGTFLRLVPLAYEANVPILGVNFGRLGYLLELRPDQLIEALASTLAGSSVTEERTALEISVHHSSDHVLEGEAEGNRVWLALNEMVLEKTVFGHTVRLSTEIDGERFLSYSADGLLIATPTGSTAYNLSAGGPVLSPRLRALVMTPVAPHLTLDRSLVLDADQIVTVRIDAERPAALVVDGQEIDRLEPGTQVRCRVAPRPVQLVTLGQRGFGRLLRAALFPDLER
jgi:NAD+ kinase